MKSANDKLIDTELFEAISSSKLILEKIEEALDLKTETERGCSQWFKTHAPETIDQFSQYTDLEKVHFARALGILISNSKKELISKEGGHKIQGSFTLTSIQNILNKSLLPYITTAEDKSQNTGVLRDLYYWSESASDALLGDYMSQFIFSSYQKPPRFCVTTSDTPASSGYLSNWLSFSASTSSVSSTSTTTSPSASSTSTTTSPSDAPDSSGYSSLNWLWGASAPSASSTSTSTTTSPSAAPAP